MTLRALFTAFVLMLGVAACAPGANLNCDDRCGERTQCDPQTRQCVAEVGDATLPDGALPPPDMSNGDMSTPTFCPNAQNEELPVGSLCSEGLGSCFREGEIYCDLQGQPTCTAADDLLDRQQPEICNELDDDCDGRVDEGFGKGDICSGGVGECWESGEVVCADDGGVVCTAVPGEPADELCDNLDNDCDGDVDEGLALRELCNPPDMALNACQFGSTACGDNGEVVCAVRQLHNGNGRIIGGRCLRPVGNFLDIVTHSDFDVPPPDLPEGQEKLDGKICVRGTIRWPNANSEIVEEPIVACSPDNAYCIYGPDGWVTIGPHDLEGDNADQNPCYLRVEDPRIALMLVNSPNVVGNMLLTPMETCQDFDPEDDPYGRQHITILHAVDDNPGVICARPWSANEREAAIARGDDIGDGNGQTDPGQLVVLAQGAGENGETARIPMQRRLSVGAPSYFSWIFYRVMRGNNVPAGEQLEYWASTDAGEYQLAGPLQPAPRGIINLGCDSGNTRRCIRADWHLLQVNSFFPEDAAQLYKPTAAAVEQ